MTLITHYTPGENNDFGGDDGMRPAALNPTEIASGIGPVAAEALLGPDTTIDTTRNSTVVGEATPALRGLFRDRVMNMAMRMRARRHGSAKGLVGPAALDPVVDWPEINIQSPIAEQAPVVSDAVTEAVTHDVAEYFGPFMDALTGKTEAASPDSHEKTHMPNGWLMETRRNVGAEPFEMFELEPVMAKPGTVMRVYHGSHQRNAVANKLEVDAMVKLGDDPKDSKQEFVPYFGESFVIEEVQKLEDGTEVSKGMIRVIPADEDGMTKTFVDTAAVTRDPRSPGFPDGSKTAEQVRAEFVADSGCKDTTKIWDVATFAFNLDLPNAEREQPAIMHNLLAALNQVCAPRILSGELTHIVSANHPNILNTLKGLGYPFEDINGYGVMKFWLKEKSDKAMDCHPAFFDVNKLWEGFYGAERPTRHQRKLQESLRQVEMPTDFYPSRSQLAA
jgi:hypothetical protein